MTGEALNLGGRTGLSLEEAHRRYMRDRSWSKHQNHTEFRGSFRAVSQTLKVRLRHRLVLGPVCLRPDWS